MIWGGKYPAGPRASCYQNHLFIFEILFRFFVIDLNRFPVVQKMSSRELICERFEGFSLEKINKIPVTRKYVHPCL